MQSQKRGDSSMPSIISTGLQVNGDIISDGDVQIEGVISGNVKSRTLTIGESGEVRGEVVADQLQVSGTVNGQIKARSVNLSRSARVQGDILHESLSIESGAFIEGNVKRINAKAAEKPAASAANVSPIKDEAAAPAPKAASGT